MKNEEKKWDFWKEWVVVVCTFSAKSNHESKYLCFGLLSMRCVDRNVMSAQSVSSALAIILYTADKTPFCWECLPHIQNQSWSTNCNIIWWFRAEKIMDTFQLKSTFRGDNFNALCIQQCKTKQKKRSA